MAPAADPTFRNRFMYSKPADTWCLPHDLVIVAFASWFSLAIDERVVVRRAANAAADIVESHKGQQLVDLSSVASAEGKPSVVMS